MKRNQSELSLESDIEEDLRGSLVERESITMDDDVTVWMDRLIELGVEVHQKQGALVIYENAFKDQDISLTEIYEARDEFDKTKRIYVGFYVDFYKNFVFDTLLSTNQIIAEANEIFVSYPKKDAFQSAPDDFQNYLQLYLNEKFKNQLNSINADSRSESTIDSLNSSSNAVDIANNGNYFFKVNSPTVPYSYKRQEFKHM